MRGHRREGRRGRGITRRGFLRTAAAAALSGPWLAAASTLGRAQVPAASQRITVGIIGVGGRGMGHLQALVGESQVVAVADPQLPRRVAAKDFVERHYAEAAAQAEKGVRTLFL